MSGGKIKAFCFCFFNKNACEYDRTSLTKDYFNDLVPLVHQMLTEIEERCENFIGIKEYNRLTKIFEWGLGLIIPFTITASLIGIIFEILLLLWISTLFLIILIIIILILKIILYKRLMKKHKKYDQISKTIISQYNSKYFHSKGYHITYGTNSVDFDKNEKEKQFWIEFSKISKIFSYDKKESIDSFFLYNSETNKELSAIMNMSKVSKKNISFEINELKHPFIKREESKNSDKSNN